MEAILKNSEKLALKYRLSVIQFIVKDLLNLLKYCIICAHFNSIFQ